MWQRLPSSYLFASDHAFMRRCSGMNTGQFMLIWLPNIVTLYIFRDKLAKGERRVRKRRAII